MRIPGPGFKKKVRDYTLADQLWIVVYVMVVPIVLILATVGIALLVSRIF